MLLNTTFLVVRVLQSIRHIHIRSFRPANGSCIFCILKKLLPKYPLILLNYASKLFTSYFTYSSIATAIAQIELKEKVDNNIKQGLRDIEIVQLNTKKNTVGIAIIFKN